MRLSSLLIVSLTFLAAAGLSLIAAGFAVTGVERSTEIAVRRTLDETRKDWAEVTADGLQVILNGTAPDEATRFTALSVVGGTVDAARIIDLIQIAPTADLAPPRFSVEILRNDSGISIIGLIPTGTDRAAIVEQLSGLVREERVTDLLETASYSTPAGWIDAMGYAVSALRYLPRAKISVVSGLVTITAISDSREEKQALEKTLTRAAPPGLRLSLDIAAPRPVITPFTLRYHIDEAGGSFDACSAESEASRDRILAAAKLAGQTNTPSCVIGMGVPSPNWARAAELSIASLAQLGAGSVTIANADITLVATVDTSPELFDQVVGELEAALPKVFALHAVLPEPEADTQGGVPEFTATLSPEGLVQLRGRLSDETLRHLVDSYAKARFGSDSVYTATRVVSDLPTNWPVRVLTGLEALSQLQRGSLLVTPDNVNLRGMSHQEEATAEIAKLLSAKLGEAESYALDISYEEPPEPEDKPVEPEVCEAELASIQEAGKIAFEPGSATIASQSRDTMDAIAAILERCGDMRLEIQGHTDSQGREEMNQNLSQARAQSVLNELRARRVPTSSYAAKGYGETNPIADNGTEEGREQNRRITFHLIRLEQGPEQESTLDAAAAENAEDLSTPETPDTTEQELPGQ
ncbi:OmpA family protein [Parasedimentitalea maritima]|uniref:OmpA family protein n=1 Tax=Parasedimentitalea maritima TaxID=2578117 RepID=A0A6A4RLL6_9RHOB|nr:OmpA family protein [Zongyanglinia marina]KAE9632608.1 OmpA family protein [Zongyanglinia marina]